MVATLVTPISGRLSDDIVPSGRFSRVADVVTRTADTGLTGTVVSGTVVPGDAGAVHPAVKITPAHIMIRMRFLFIIITGCPAENNKLSGRQ